MSDTLYRALEKFVGSSLPRSAMFIAKSHFEIRAPEECYLSSYYKVPFARPMVSAF